MQKDNHPIKIQSISEMHRLLGLPRPLHPLIGLLDNTKMTVDDALLPNTFLFDFYKISYKKTQQGKMGYGQGHYDFDEGGMIFTAPNQVVTVAQQDKELYGFSLVIHADFIRNYPLGQQIKKYGFFDYDTNEALYLSDKERITVLNVLKNIEEELNGTIDDFSQDVMIAYIEVLLNLCKRFYKRQFITRKMVNHDLLAKMEQLLNAYFDTEEPLRKGLPTVDYLAEQLFLSPRYLSDMLRSLTGQNTQQHIHEKLIEKAKEKLSAEQLSVSEIAYQLGFEHPQSFNKLFKKKMHATPLEYRQSFN
jgi:AraC family transcriptional activator of pobA